MGEVRFIVKGFAEINKRLAHLPDAAKRKGLEPLIVNSVKPMMLVAKSLAPDDPRTSPPRDLKTSIVASKSQKGYRAARAEGTVSAFVGPTRFGYPQALFAEFGTIHQPPRPYLRPAFHAGRDQAIRIISAGFADQVDKTLRKFGAG